MKFNISAIMIVILMTPLTSRAVVLSYQEGDGGLYSSTDVTWIDEAQSNINFGSDGTFGVEGHPLRFGLIRFSNIFGSAIGQIASGQTVTSALLSVTTDNSVFSASPDEFSIHRILTNWSENVVTYNTFGAAPGAQQGIDYIASSSSSIFPTQLGTTYIFDVTDIVNEWRTASPNFGFLIAGTLGSFDAATFRSDNFGTINSRPFLEVTTTPDVAAPEPGTMALLSLGLAGIGFSKRSKR